MPYSNDAKNAMLDQLGTLAGFVSLHTAYSAAGANELAGGTPAYARKAIAYAAAAGGVKAASNQPVLDVPAASTVQYLGLWSAAAAGTFYGMYPIGGSTVEPFVGESTTDTLTTEGHGFAAGLQVTVWDTLGSVIPGGLTAGDLYYVVNPTADTLQLSLTSGGAAIDLTADGAGFLQLILPEVYGAQGTLVVTNFQLNLNLLT